MARLAAARGFATRIAGQLDEIIELFLEPDDDPKGRDREALFECVIEDAGRLSRVAETAQAAFEKIDPMEPPPEESDDEEAEGEEVEAEERSGKRAR
jgi:hypothetical protein